MYFTKDEAKNGPAIHIRATAIDSCPESIPRSRQHKPYHRWWNTMSYKFKRERKIETRERSSRLDRFVLAINLESVKSEIANHALDFANDRECCFMGDLKLKLVL